MELRNSDDEALILAADGLLVWLSHPGINKAVVIRQVLTLVAYEALRLVAYEALRLVAYPAFR